MEIMPFKLPEFEAHASHMGDEERALYLALLRVYYGREKPLSINPNDAYAVARLCMQMGFEPHMRRPLRRILTERFICLPAYQYHPRLEANLPRAWEPWPHAMRFIRNQLEAQALERVQ